MIGVPNPRSPLGRFLELAACPDCRAGLVSRANETILTCEGSRQHQYRVNQWGFFGFAEKAIMDKYEDEDYVREYVGVAYGYRLINTSTSHVFVGIGQSEGLYRCMSEIALSTALQNGLNEKQEFRVLDMACGVGRRVADLATNLPNAFVVGLDYSEQMIRYATDILLGEGIFQMDFRRYGFGIPNMSRFALSNVFLAQADARRLPLRTLEEDPDSGFDLVFNSMLIDRIQTHSGIEECLRQSVSILKMHGTLIFACPFNWINAKSWDAYGRSRTCMLSLLESLGLSIEIAFDGLVYRELMDPHGMYLELPVLVAKGRKVQ